MISQVVDVTLGDQITKILFLETLPSSKAMDVAKQLIACGVELGELDNHYKLLGGRQVIESASPGLELYAEIQEWNNWSSAP